MKDQLIDTLIKPPRPVYVGGGWDKTERLIPTGDAAREDVVAERLQPPTPLRGE